MTKNGKRHIANKEGINPDETVELQEAIALIKNKANSKFYYYEFQELFSQ